MQAAAHVQPTCWLKKVIFQDIFWETNTPTVPAICLCVAQGGISKKRFFFVCQDKQQGTKPNTSLSEWHMCKNTHRQPSQGSKPLSVPVCGSLDLKCGLILEWTVITSPPAFLVSVSYQLVFKAQETGKHKIIHNKCSCLCWTLARNGKRDFNPI